MVADRLEYPRMRVSTENQTVLTCQFKNTKMDYLALIPQCKDKEHALMSLRAKLRQESTTG